MASTLNNSPGNCSEGIFIELTSGRNQLRSQWWSSHCNVLADDADSRVSLREKRWNQGTCTFLSTQWPWCQSAEHHVVKTTHWGISCLSKWLALTWELHASLLFTAIETKLPSTWKVACHWHYTEVSTAEVTFFVPQNIIFYFIYLLLTVLW